MSEVTVDNGKNPPFGRKVFFVNPSYKVKTHFIDKLREEEYEVYSIESWKDVKSYLSKNPESICFFGIDSQLTIPAWTSLVSSFKKDPVLNSCICGFLSESSLKDIEKNLEIFNKVNLMAGVNSLAGDIEKTELRLRQILNVNGAKGRRQFVRCSCFNEEAYVYLTTTSDAGISIMHQFKIVDISTATVAIEIPASFKGKLKKNQWIHSTKIVLKGKQIDTNLRVFLLKTTPRGTEIGIMTYSEKFGEGEKGFIKGFVHETLKKQMDMSINGMPEDKTDYASIARNEEMEHSIAKTKEEDKKKEEEKKSGK